LDSLPKSATTQTRPLLEPVVAARRGCPHCHGRGWIGRQTRWDEKTHGWAQTGRVQPCRCLRRYDDKVLVPESRVVVGKAARTVNRIKEGE